MINSGKMKYVVLVLLWMGLIFYLSHQPVERSNKLSKDVTRKILEVGEKIQPGREFNLRRMNHIVRKNAHFMAYLILGILVLNLLRSIGFRGYRSIVLAIVISILYAISDEVHQLFVVGRGGQVRDVLIDSGGAMVGILFYSFILKLAQKQKK